MTNVKEPARDCKKDGRSGRRYVATGFVKDPGLTTEFRVVPGSTSCY
jgi:hypothetical protein